MSRTGGESCKVCGRDLVVGFLVTDEIWENVVGNPDVCWCVQCFDEKAHDLGVEYKFLDLFPCPWNVW